MEHQLVIDYREGKYEVHCTCGQWESEPIPARVQGLREIYARIHDDHSSHVAAAVARAAKLTPGQAGGGFADPFSPAVSSPC
jgi:hypothetical protein